jgi:thioredoxin 1
MTELNESNFTENTREGLVLVDFYAPWCGPCRAVAPVLEYLENVEVFKVNIDDAPSLASDNNVMQIPTLLFLKDGVEVDRVVGVESQATLQGMVDHHNAN